jgi:hypothetical protein
MKKAIAQLEAKCRAKPDGGQQVIGFWDKGEK